MAKTEDRLLATFACCPPAMSGPKKSHVYTLAPGEVGPRGPDGAEGGQGGGVELSDLV